MPPAPTDPLRVACEIDPLGHRVHTAFAAAYAASLPFATAPEGITFALLAGYTLLRLPKTRHAYGALFARPVVWALGLWLAWSALTIAWSPDPAQGWDEVQAARAVVLPLLVWPVIDRAPVLVIAALAGVAAQNVVQLAQALGVAGLEPGAEGRLDGLLHAGHVGAWCVAAMCWHVSAILHAPRGLRSAFPWIALAGLAAAAAGLVGSGSRGPWIAAAVTLPLCPVVIAARRPHTRRAALVLVVLGLVGASAAWPLARRMVEPRIERAASEVEYALRDRDYTTSAGLRIGMWRWGWSIFQDAPAFGRGAGCYQDELWQRAEYRSLVDRQRNDEDVDYLTRDHPHSTYVYTLARSGAIGGATLLVLLGLALLRAARAPPTHPWADGSLFALAAWIVGAQFDCFELNGSTFGLFALIVAVTLMPPGPDRIQ